MKRIALFLATILSVSMLGLSACAKKQGAIDVYMPDGAPALALGLPMYEDKTDDDVNYHVVSSTVIQTYVTGESPEAEVCVLPVNLAAKLLGDGSVYRMAGVVTHGNMYLISENGKAYTQANATELIGKTVGVVQLNNVPGLTMKAALSALGIACNDVSKGEEKSAEAVNLAPVDVKTLSGADLYLAPSPAVDKRVQGGNFSFVGSLQELYGGDKGYPQAAIVVKNDLIEKNPAWVEALLSKIEANSAWLNSADKALIADTVGACLAKGLSPTFTAENLTDGAIAHSGVWLQRMDDAAVAETDLFLSRLVAIDATKAAVPSRAFYYALR